MVTYQTTFILIPTDCQKKNRNFVFSSQLITNFIQNKVFAFHDSIAPRLLVTQTSEFNQQIKPTLRPCVIYTAAHLYSRAELS